MGPRNPLIIQAAKDVQASQIALADIFERHRKLFPTSRNLRQRANDDRNDGYDGSDTGGSTLYPWGRDKGDQGNPIE